MTERTRSGGIIPAVGEAIADIREKLVEEAWFGRSLSQHPVSDAFGVEPSTERDPLQRTRRDQNYGRAEVATDANAEHQRPISAAFHGNPLEQQHPSANQQALEPHSHGMDVDR